MRKTRKELTLCLTLAIAFLALPGCEAQDDSEAASPEVEAVSQDASSVEQVAPHEMTCAELREMLLAEEHEEEASYVAVWAYGLQTGATGMDFEKNPVTKAGLEDFVTRVILSCKADPDQLFVDAILEKRP